METVIFKNKQYAVVANHEVPELLAAEGLKSQMTIQGKRGATKLLQIWDHKLGEVYKTISLNAEIEVELKK